MKFFLSKSVRRFAKDLTPPHYGNVAFLISFKCSYGFSPFLQLLTHTIHVVRLRLEGWIQGTDEGLRIEKFPEKFPGGFWI